MADAITMYEEEGREDSIEYLGQLVPCRNGNRMRIRKNGRSEGKTRAGFEGIAKC